MPLTLYGSQQRTTPSMSGAPRLSVPALVDPTGAALSDLAGQVSKIGQDMYNVQREADLQDRIGKATAEIAELELNFDRDQDFRTAPQRFQEQADAIRDKYLDGVSDSAVATAFRKQFQQLSLAKSINVRKDAWAKEKDYNVASLDSNIDTYATAAANSKNPAEAAIVENQARIAIASAQNGGWISAEDAGKRERVFLTKRDSAIVIRDMSLNPGLTATKLSLDPTYAANVDPVARERYADQAFRRSLELKKSTDAAAEAERKRRGDELYKEALSRQAKGALTPAYVEEIRAFVEPTEYKSLLDALSGKDRKDDPVAFAEVQDMLYRNPPLAESMAFFLHKNGKLRNETLSSVLSRAREIGRTEGPRTAYERERQYITNAIKPSDFVRDPAGSARYAVVIREFDDFALSGTRTDADLRTKADEILKKWTLVDMVDLAKKTGLGGRPTPELQLEANTAEAARLMAERESGRIPPQEFNRRMEALDKSSRAAERAIENAGRK